MARESIRVKGGRPGGISAAEAISESSGTRVVIEQRRGLGQGQRAGGSYKLRPQYSSNIEAEMYDPEIRKLIAQGLVEGKYVRITPTQFQKTQPGQTIPLPEEREARASLTDERISEIRAAEKPKDKIQRIRSTTPDLVPGAEKRPIEETQFQASLTPQAVESIRRQRRIETAKEIYEKQLAPQERELLLARTLSTGRGFNVIGIPFTEEDVKGKLRRQVIEQFAEEIEYKDQPTELVQFRAYGQAIESPVGTVLTSAALGGGLGLGAKALSTASIGKAIASPGGQRLGLAVTTGVFGGAEILSLSKETPERVAGRLLILPAELTAFGIGFESVSPGIIRQKAEIKSPLISETRLKGITTEIRDIRTKDFSQIDLELRPVKEKIITRTPSKEIIRLESNIIDTASGKQVGKGFDVISLGGKGKITGGRRLSPEKIQLDITRPIQRDVIIGRKAGEYTELIGLSGTIGKGRQKITLKRAVGPRITAGRIGEAEVIRSEELFIPKKHKGILDEFSPLKYKIETKSKGITRNIVLEQRPATFKEQFKTIIKEKSQELLARTLSTGKRRFIGIAGIEAKRISLRQEQRASQRQRKKQKRITTNLFVPDLMEDQRQKVSRRPMSITGISRTPIKDFERLFNIDQIQRPRRTPVQRRRIPPYIRIPREGLTPGILEPPRRPPIIPPTLPIFPTQLKMPKRTLATVKEKRITRPSVFLPSIGGLLFNVRQRNAPRLVTGFEQRGYLF